MIRTLTSAVCIGVLPIAAITQTAAPDLPTELAEPASFDNIADNDARAAALFEELAKVFTHPRCLNCHPVNGGPRQGDLMSEHQPPVVRGPADMGATGMECNTCHGEANVEYAGADGAIPGHLPWAMAPVSMGWIGKSVSEICEQVKDPERNGGRTLAEIHEHNAEDGLVGWGWEPGEGRTPAPGTQEQFGRLTQAWIDAGAACPS